MIHRLGSGMTPDVVWWMIAVHIMFSSVWHSVTSLTEDDFSTYYWPLRRTSCESDGVMCWARFAEILFRPTRPLHVWHVVMWQGDRRTCAGVLCQCRMSTYLNGTELTWNGAVGASLDGSGQTWNSGILHSVQASDVIPLPSPEPSNDTSMQSGIGSSNNWRINQSLSRSQRATVLLLLRVWRQGAGWS